MKYLEIIGLAIILFVFVRGLYRYIPVITGKWRIKSVLIRLVPLIELALWALLILWAPGRVLEESQLLSVIRGALAILLIALVGWYLLRDFVSGTILRIENLLEPGCQIVTKYSEGVVKRLGFRSAEIINAKGESVRIPYSLLSKSSITRPSDNPKRVEHVISLTLRSTLSAVDLREKLLRALLTMPWIVAEDEIRIELTKEISDGPSALVQPLEDLPAHGNLPAHANPPPLEDLPPSSSGLKSSSQLNTYGSSQLRTYHAQIHFHATSSSMAIKTKEELEQKFE